MKQQLCTLAFGLTLALATTASAHIDVVSHMARTDGFNDQKVGPCGVAGSTRGSMVYTYEPGETITVAVAESIPHPGWFRIAFDADGEDDLVPYASLEPPDFYTNDAVLLDELDRHDAAGFGEMRSWEVELPDVECENCTLQVIQVMLDKLPYDANDLYFRCIDMVLKRSESASTDPAGAPTEPVDEPPAATDPMMEAASPPADTNPAPVAGSPAPVPAPMAATPAAPADARDVATNAADEGGGCAVSTGRFAPASASGSAYWFMLAPLALWARRRRLG